MLLFTAVVALLLHTAAPDAGVSATPDSGAPARNPAYSRDGRLAVSVHGDLWIVSTRGEWTRVTSGAAWDREPAWTGDGSAIVFSSDRSGKFDLLRIPVGVSGAMGDAERLTSSTLPDGESAVAQTVGSFSFSIDSARPHYGFVK